MKNQIRYNHVLLMFIQRSIDAGELKKFFDGGKDSRYWVLRMVVCLLEIFIVLEKIVRHQLSLVVLDVS